MSQKISPRLLALRVLRKVEREGAFSNRALDELLEANPDMDPRDRGLATALVYGVLRHQARMDHHIDALAHNPSRIKGELRSILQIAAYELREMGHPLHAVASESGKLVARLDPRGRLRGLVTALLAGIDRSGADHDASLDAAGPVDTLRFRWSIPGWLARRWVRELGPEQALARGQALGQVPSLDLRVDLSRFDAVAVRAQLLEEHPNIRLDEADPAHPATIRSRGGGDVFYGPAYESGAISIQSLGAQQAALALNAAAPIEGTRVLDACAGMGTKTVQLAELMRRRGELVAIDLDPNKLEELELHRSRCALEGEGFSLTTVAGDLAEGELDLGAPFDAILLDAPCTGLGDLGRHPELRGRARPEHLRVCAALQSRLLRAAVRHLRPGGRLVYAVCSLEPEEGRDLVKALAPELGLELLETRAWTPEAHACDGFFHATLRKPD